MIYKITRVILHTATVTGSSCNVYFSVTETYDYCILTNVSTLIDSMLLLWRNVRATLITFTLDYPQHLLLERPICLRGPTGRRESLARENL